MKKIEQFQITSMSISGFKSYEKPTELTFGNPTVITGGNGRGKTSIADAIAFAVTGLPLFGERGLDRLHNEKNPDVAIQMRFVDENGITHELTRIRRNNDMSIYYDGHTIRQLDLADLFGERDVFLSILNPLYFIEELGTSGKNLLERYLPFIPQETILAQLPGEVQASLKDEVILSPDAYLKGRRAEIRELEERITYLGGQKDLAATQKKQYETMRVEFSEGITSLQNEIAALAEKQFADLDTAKMQEQLVELSQRYDEMARDERGDTVQQQKELRALREKIVRRQSEQYQSKFTEPLAEIAAKVNDLGTRYKRESVAYKAFHAGMDCPTCHRRVTEETLPEVQAALKKNISELYAAGTEQKGQLTELQEMDKKARDTFDAFKEADLRKWTEDAAELERRCAEQSETSSQAAESLRSEIQALTAELEYGNLTQAEYGRLRECREQCRELESKLSALNEELDDLVSQRASRSITMDDFLSRSTEINNEIINVEGLLQSSIQEQRPEARLDMHSIEAALSDDASFPDSKIEPGFLDRYANRIVKSNNRYIWMLQLMNVQQIMPIQSERQPIAMVTYKSGVPYDIEQEQIGKQDKESAGPDCATICRPQDFFLNMGRTKRKRKLVEWLESCQENQVSVLDEKMPLLSFAVDFVTAYEYQKARGIKIHPGL